MMGPLAAQASISLTKDKVKAWGEQREEVEEPLDKHNLHYYHSSIGAFRGLTARESGINMALES